MKESALQPQTPWITSAPALLSTSIMSRMSLPISSLWVTTILQFHTKMCVCVHVCVFVKMCAFCFLVYMQGEQCNVVPDPVDDIVADFGQQQKKEGVVNAKHSHTYTHLSSNKPHIFDQINLKELKKRYIGLSHYIIVI